jgi:hypothetical protein
MLNLHIHCPVINQEKIHYYLGIVTDQANYMTDWRYNIRVKNGADLIEHARGATLRWIYNPAE